MDTTIDDENVAPVNLAHAADVDTVIVSDLHLGSTMSRSKQLTELLRQVTYKRLILNGDVFDDLNFKRLSRDDWEFLSFIRASTNERLEHELVWVIGNHDGGAPEILSHLLGIHIHEEYVWNHAGRTLLAVHGHQFDAFVSEHSRFVDAAIWAYSIVQKLDPKHRASRLVKNASRQSKRWMRRSDKVAKEASAHGKSTYGAQVVTCGHTHHPMDVMLDGVRYLNSGSWTDKPSTYIVIDHDGTIAIHSCA
jgi:UDP-2,3-diacylglucosamine pyrophosphatase LpxH